MKNLAWIVALGMAAVSCGSTPDIASLPQPMEGPAPIPAETASAVSGAPADMTGINSHHDRLLSEDSIIRFGTQADPATVTLGPTDGGYPDWPPYDGKHSLNIKMPLQTAVLAPLDVRFVGLKNRSAEYRQDDPNDQHQSPFDDLMLCFESASDDWPGMVFCAYHLYTSPLLPGHLQHEDCGIQEKWDGGGAEAGRIYYLDNSTDQQRRNPESCAPLLGAVVQRGGVIGYSGTVGDNPHTGFMFKVRAEGKNPLTEQGDPYLHWVQPKVFFYWQCYTDDAAFQPGVLAYPFDCE